MRNNLQTLLVSVLFVGAGSVIWFWYLFDWSANSIGALPARTFGQFAAGWASTPILLLIGASNWKWLIYWIIALWLGISDFLLIAGQMGFSLLLEIEAVQIAMMLVQSCVVVLLFCAGMVLGRLVPRGWVSRPDTNTELEARVY